MDEGPGGCFGAGDVVFVMYMLHRQRISRVEGRQVQGEERCMEGPEFPAPSPWVCSVLAYI